MLLDEQSQLTKSKSKAEKSDGVAQPGGQKLISFEEVEKHNKEDDAWVIINVSIVSAWGRCGAGGWLAGDGRSGGGGWHDMMRSDEILSLGTAMKRGCVEEGR